ncbi:infection structure specific, partial [Fusarium circinatum]
MQTKYISLLAAAAATTVSAAEVKRVDVVHIFETLHVGKHIPSFTPNKRSVNAIF